MRSGDDYLALAKQDADRLHALDRERAEVRESFLSHILQASQRRKTQEEIAKVSRYSRQRISQFLKEARAT